MDKNQYFSFIKYIRSKEGLSTSQEDYLEMIYRLTVGRNLSFTRIKDIAENLNIKTSSASSMIKFLKEQGYLLHQDYSHVLLSEDGLKIGKYLFDRHHVIESFIDLLGIEEDRLLETEKLEHLVNPETLKKIELLNLFFEKNKNIEKEFKSFSGISEKKK